MPPKSRRVETAPLCRAILDLVFGCLSHADVLCVAYLVCSAWSAGRATWCELRAKTAAQCQKLISLCHPTKVLAVVVMRERLNVSRLQEICARLPQVASLNLRLHSASVPGLHDFSGLRELDICVALTDDGFAALCNLITLESLSVDDCFDKVSNTSFRHLGNLTNLRSVTFVRCLNLDVTALGTVTSLQDFGLHDVDLAALVFDEVCTCIASWAFLQVLVLSHTDADVSHFAILGTSHSITTLRLVNETQVYVSALRAIAGLASLRHLEFEHCMEVADLCPLEKLPLLESLSLLNCNERISYHTIKRLAAIPTLASLRLQHFRDAFHCDALFDAFLRGLGYTVTRPKDLVVAERVVPK